MSRDLTCSLFCRYEFNLLQLSSKVELLYNTLYGVSVDIPHVWCWRLTLMVLMVLCTTCARA